MGVVQGFDSRYWDGTVPANFAYRFFAGKLTQGENFFNHLAPLQFDRARELSLPRLGWLFHKAGADVAGSVRGYKLFYQALEVEGPPVVDVEDTSVNPSAAYAASVWVTVQEVEQKIGRAVVIYAAAWHWNRYLKQFFPAGHPIYQRDLWESDPPPPTPEPGYFGPPVITQILLDWTAPGFGGDKIDVDETTTEWLAANMKPPVVLPPTTAKIPIEVIVPTGRVGVTVREV